MPKYIKEYDTRIIDENNFIDECDTRLYEDFDSGHRITWVNLSDRFAFSCAILSPPTNNDFRWFSRNIKKKHIVPYIKIRTFDMVNKKVTGVCRLSIYHPKYIIGYNEDMVLTKDMIDIIMCEFNKCSYADDKLTNWQYAIEAANDPYGCKKCKYMIPTGLPIPDYYQLLK